MNLSLTLYLKITTLVMYTWLYMKFRFVSIIEFHIEQFSKNFYLSSQSQSKFNYSTSTSRSVMVIAYRQENRELLYREGERLTNWKEIILLDKAELQPNLLVPFINDMTFSKIRFIRKSNRLRVCSRRIGYFTRLYLLCHRNGKVPSISEESE